MNSMSSVGQSAHTSCCISLVEYRLIPVNAALERASELEIHQRQSEGKRNAEKTDLWPLQPITKSEPSINCHQSCQSTVHQSCQSIVHQSCQSTVFRAVSELYNRAVSQLSVNCHQSCQSTVIRAVSQLSVSCPSEPSVNCPSTVIRAVSQLSSELSVNCQSTVHQSPQWFSDPRLCSESDV